MRTKKQELEESLIKYIKGECGLSDLRYVEYIDRKYCIRIMISKSYIEMKIPAFAYEFYYRESELELEARLLRKIFDSPQQILIFLNQFNKDLERSLIVKISKGKIEEKYKIITNEECRFYRNFMAKEFDR